MSALTKGNEVWVEGKDTAGQPYELATVTSTEPLRCQMKANGAQTSPAVELCSLANKTVEKDNTALVSLSDATLLHNTRKRYADDDIYTFTGSIVTSVNPCKPMPGLYDEAAMSKCLNERKDPEPHLFVTAVLAARATRIISPTTNRSHARAHILEYTSTSS